jgi:hypothetical protein
MHPDDIGRPDSRSPSKILPWTPPRYDLFSDRIDNRRRKKHRHRAESEPSLAPQTKPLINHSQASAFTGARVKCIISNCSPCIFVVPTLQPVTNGQTLIHARTLKRDTPNRSGVLSHHIFCPIHTLTRSLFQYTDIFLRQQSLAGQS